MATVVWSENALHRLREQVQYIVGQSCSREIAWKWANDIFDEAQGLADFSCIGHRLPEFPDSPYLEILVRKNFRLIYRIDGDKCVIVTVRRCSMLLGNSTMDELDSVQ